ncbi:MAG: hypothetical protein EPN21_17150 [Methylococcaceae bacterium]|nr:MAG: hypothetical protein EPN21_17150 [Methylococcaceae bacterium]
MLDQIDGDAAFVNVVVVLGADFPQVLDADGQFAMGHGVTMYGYAPFIKLPHLAQFRHQLCLANRQFPGYSP